MNPAALKTNVGGLPETVKICMFKDSQGGEIFRPKKRQACE